MLKALSVHGGLIEPAYSRRGFLQTAAGTAGLIAGSGIGLPKLARAAALPAFPQALDADDGPQHIPSGFPNPALPAGARPRSYISSAPVPRTKTPQSGISMA